MGEPLAPAIDLTVWREEIEQALRPLLETFEDTFGYPPGDNLIGDADPGDAGPDDAGRDDLPPPLAAFYQVIGEVSLPDVGNGHFVHPSGLVLDQLREHGTVRVADDVEGIVFGSDGGGLLYAVATTGTIHRSRAASRDAGFELAATDVSDYLARLKDVVIEFVRTGDPGRL